jgi:hypothetical protein
LGRKEQAVRKLSGCALKSYRKAWRLLKFSNSDKMGVFHVPSYLEIVHIGTEGRNWPTHGLLNNVTALLLTDFIP